PFGSSTPIANPTNYQFNANATVTVVIKDNAGLLCDNPTTFNSQFVSNPSNYTFTYYPFGSSTPIANPTNYQFNANATVTVVIKDNAGLL
ncbi:hypothetical protein BOQ60_25875, partial [Chryseobacterium sp. CH1]